MGGLPEVVLVKIILPLYWNHVEFVFCKLKSDMSLLKAWNGSYFLCR